MSDLRRACDDVLIDGLSPTLKASIDRLLARGESKAEILAFCRRIAAKSAELVGNPEGGRGNLTVAAVEAYLERK